MSIFYRSDTDYITIMGQTYPHREAIKALGGRFVGESKTWQLPLNPENLERVEHLCTKAGGVPKGSFPSPETAPPSPALAPTPELPPDSLTISQLLDRVAITIQSNFAQPVWLIGEIQSLQMRAHGIYLNLAEEDKAGSGQGTLTINAVAWQNQLRAMATRHGKDKIQAVLQDGMQVRCLCQVSLYKGRGSLSLTILDLDLNFTQGQLALAREKLLRELRAQGLDSANKACKLPLFPLHVGLLTADGSRARSDFLHQLTEGGFPGSITFVPIATQGDKVPRDIPWGIRQLVRAGCDLIIVTRGGGSAADLRWFDVAEVAYAVARCPIPVIAAIGHHDDVCVAEEICFQRRKTPTAAADFVLECFRSVRERLERAAKLLYNSLTVRERRLVERQAHLMKALSQGAQSSLNRRSERLQQQTHQIERAFLHMVHGAEKRLQASLAALPMAAQTRLHQLELRLSSIVARRLQQAAEQAFHRQSNRLEEINRHLISHDPTPWLKQGWTCLYTTRGKMTSLAQANVGELVHARLQDGSLELQITQIKGKNP